MNLISPWNIVFVVGFVVFVTIRGCFAPEAQRQTKAINRLDWQERLLLAFLAIGNLFLPLIYLLSPLINFANYPLPTWVHVIGALSMVAALYLFWRSHADLGVNWSVTLQIREGHRLIQSGVYRFIRHPMYLSIWIWGIAQACLLDNWLAGLGTLIPFSFMYFLRTPREEAMLCEALGDEYRQYMRTTGRMFPKWLNRSDG